MAVQVLLQITYLLFLAGVFSTLISAITPVNRLAIAFKSSVRSLTSRTLISAAIPANRFAAAFN